MQISTNKESLYINQVIGQKSETFIEEEDVVVPDIKPDILNTISTNGTICVYKKEVMDGKVKIDGCINTYIIYLADDLENVTRALNTNINFSQIVEIPNVKDGMFVDAKLDLKDIECKVLNGRKINLKAIVDMDVKVFSNDEVSFINEIHDCKDIQLLNENMELNSLLGIGHTKIYAKDTLVIDSIDNLMEILNFDVKIINKELKVSYNKILIKADACVKILYLTEDNRICKTSQIIPIMGFVDMQDVNDDDICNVKFEIENIIIKPNSIDEHSIYIEIEMEAICLSYKKKQVNLIQDLYSPSINLKYNQKQIRTITEKNIVKDIYSIRENRNIVEIGNSKILDVKVMPVKIKQTNMNDRLVVEGTTKIKIFFEGKHNGIETKIIDIPFNYSIDVHGLTKSSEVDVDIDVINEEFLTMPDQNIDMKIDLEFKVNLNNIKLISVIDDIEEDDIRKCERYSLIIYFVKPEDTLWKIAKKFHSTMEKISELNQLDNDNKLNIGEQLFIPICI